MTARPTARAMALAALLSVWLCATALWAQATVQTQISADKVEVGQQLTVRIQGDSPDSALDNPRLRVPPSFVVSGPSVGTQKKITIVNGRMESSTGTTATWVLTATKAGTFEIGPGTFNDGGKTVSGNSTRVQVVAQGTLPQRPRRRGRFPFGNDPFSPFGGGSIFDDLFHDQAVPRIPAAPPEFQVDHAPDAVAFLRATLTPAKAVVGQQMTLRVYAYGARGSFAEGPAKEARHPDFYAYPITGNSLKQNTYSVTIDGKEYLGLKVREIALFPLKAGELQVGPMTMSFYGRGYLTQTAPEGIERASSTLVASVQEPPADTRPPGYQLGDVGDFTLKATVSPKQVEAGGAVSVVAELSGSGRLPARLATPERKGIDWLEPSLRDNVQVDASDAVGGSRTFSYLVRLNEPGQVDLGELTLPYYSPTTKHYEVLRARLGRVTVRPGTAPPAPSETPRAKLSDELSARAKLFGPVPAAWSPADERWFYPTLLLPPVGVVLLRASLTALATARRRRAARSKDPGELAKQAHGTARQKLARGDLKEGVPALERALFLRLEASTGLKGRALLLHELSPAAQRAGVPAETAALLAEVLGECQQARFAGSGADGKALLSRATRCMKELGRIRPRTEDKS